MPDPGDTAAGDKTGLTGGGGGTATGSANAGANAAANAAAAAAQADKQRQEAKEKAARDAFRAYEKAFDEKKNAIENKVRGSLLAGSAIPTGLGQVPPSYSKSPVVNPSRGLAAPSPQQLSAMRAAVSNLPGLSTDPALNNLKAEISGLTSSFGPRLDFKTPNLVSTVPTPKKEFTSRVPDTPKQLTGYSPQQLGAIKENKDLSQYVRDVIAAGSDPEVVKALSNIPPAAPPAAVKTRSLPVTTPGLSTNMDPNNQTTISKTSPIKTVNTGKIYGPPNPSDPNSLIGGPITLGPEELGPENVPLPSITVRDFLERTYPARHPAPPAVNSTKQFPDRVPGSDEASPEYGPLKSTKYQDRVPPERLAIDMPGLGPLDRVPPERLAIDMPGLGPLDVPVKNPYHEQYVALGPDYVKPGQTSGDTTSQGSTTDLSGIPSGNTQAQAMPPQISPPVDLSLDPDSPLSDALKDYSNYKIGQLPSPVKDALVSFGANPDQTLGEVLGNLGVTKNPDGTITAPETSLDKLKEVFNALNVSVKLGPIEMNPLHGQTLDQQLAKPPNVNTSYAGLNVNPQFGGYAVTPAPQGPPLGGWSQAAPPSQPTTDATTDATTDVTTDVTTDAPVETPVQPPNEPSDWRGGDRQDKKIEEEEEDIEEEPTPEELAASEDVTPEEKTETYANVKSEMSGKVKNPENVARVMSEMPRGIRNAYINAVNSNNYENAGKIYKKSLNIYYRNRQKASYANNSIGNALRYATT